MVRGESENCLQRSPDACSWSRARSSRQEFDHRTAAKNRHACGRQYTPRMAPALVPAKCPDSVPVLCRCPDRRLGLCSPASAADGRGFQERCVRKDRPERTCFYRKKKGTGASQNGGEQSHSSGGNQATVRSLSNCLQMKWCFSLLSFGRSGLFGPPLCGGSAPATPPANNMPRRPCVDISDGCLIEGVRPDHVPPVPSDRRSAGLVPALPPSPTDGLHRTARPGACTASRPKTANNACQPAIAQQITEGGAGYVLALKQN